MNYNIALIPGDGIGKEVVPEGVRAMQTLATKFGFQVTFSEFPFSCQHYLKYGTMMPPDGLETTQAFRRHTSWCGW